jgi:predicted Fe-Mo cluster-binding NifX family protein
MKIAISAQSDSFNAHIDKRFARCQCFVILDTTTKGVEFLPNSLKDLDIDVAMHVVDFLCKKEVSKVIASDFGIKIKPLLYSKKIQMIVYNDDTMTIKKMITILLTKYQYN